MNHLFVLTADDFYYSNIPRTVQMKESIFVRSGGKKIS